MSVSIVSLTTANLIIFLPHYSPWFFNKKNCEQLECSPSLARVQTESSLRTDAYKNFGK